MSHGLGLFFRFANLAKKRAYYVFRFANWTKQLKNKNGKKIKKSKITIRYWQITNRNDLIIRGGFSSITELFIYL